MTAAHRRRKGGDVPVDLPISVHVDAEDVPAVDSGFTGVTGRYFSIVGELLSSTWQRILPWNIG
jgi:hypothetical protein